MLLSVDIASKFTGTNSLAGFDILPTVDNAPLADDFAQLVWSADFGLFTPFVAAKYYYTYTLCDYRQLTLATGVPKWEYCSRYQDVDTKMAESRNGC